MLVKNGILSVKNYFLVCSPECVTKVSRYILFKKTWVTNYHQEMLVVVWTSAELCYSSSDLNRKVTA